MAISINLPKHDVEQIRWKIKNNCKKNAVINNVLVLTKIYVICL